MPEQYDFIDVREECLEAAHKIMEGVEENISRNIISTTYITNLDDHKLPINDNQYDLIFTFFSLEHLYPLQAYLNEYKRILNPGGRLVGAIPTEGGLAWGLGRFFTTRRSIMKKYGLDYDKIIALEHCNTARGVLKALDNTFCPESNNYLWWPLRLPCIDLNLTISFDCKRQ